MLSLKNTKPPNRSETSAPDRGHTGQRTLEERQAAARRFQLIQEALQAPHTTPPSGLRATLASSRPLRYRSQATQSSPSGARTTADVINSPTIVGVSFADEDEYHGGAPAAISSDVRDPILDGSDALDNRSIHGSLTSAEQPQRVVVILDSDEEGISPYPSPVAGTPDQQSQESISPPPPGQRPRPRTPSPSPSWEYVPMPGAFPATQYGADEPTLPHHNGGIYTETEMDWNSSDEDEDYFCVGAEIPTRGSL